MIVCITAQGNNLDSEIDPRFGRCSYFIFYDTETKTYEVFPNKWKEAMGGAGTQAAQFVLEKGAKKIITGNVGPRAEAIFKLAGIEVVLTSGKVKEVINNL
ncbi:MAG: dinitrogenase iron-molybdenum cofactor biosynthesis protein [Thermodesulfobacterium geofontis]|uniref:Dinitrogenase iron-molybdenum cofactor biosynthesis protein n=1 Tax=Thermodesulfobacterium geofontis TaxID=1295609 RepID=A0A2N7PQF5_9BACT|nr:MAG: dinitrogenase iron-molybdenum cofactor biosynthesis protein [Thermodesulfobacterium geofontis]PMP97641.1 MAG: dinitrogenase iron-molybdenum cofactor biosynthesis protein [Thermodesulfobacterium geofontis]